jgi:REP element-mobilizing transposase RayT
MKELCGPPIEIARECRPLIGRAIVKFFRGHRDRLLALAVGKLHVHGLVELKDDMRVIRALWGDAKRHSSRAVKNQMPGTIWAAGGEHKRVTNRGHHENTFDYILYEQGPSAWTWSFRDPSDDGIFGRKRPHPRKPRRKP